MKKKFLLITLMAAIFVCALAISANAAAPMPSKPDIGVSFGEVTTIDGFAAPSELYAGTTQRVLLTDGNGAYVTYPTYYVTKDSTTFDFDFSKLNDAQGIQYTKKSVVMLEIPSGVTAISNSYFAGTGNFPLCVSVQVPGSVTSYGSGMFQTNTVIRVVDFLDGTEPVTMGDAMFSSNWSVGTTVLEYVRFPNNLVSIGNNTFGKSYANKTIIFGTSLKSIGTGFFGESTPDNKDTFLYVSDNFFKDTDMFANLFGSYDQYHNNLFRVTLFYTGTQAQAQALVDKGLVAQAGYVWSNATLVSANDYDYASNKPGRNSIVIVYDYNKCDAFYNGQHVGEEKILVDAEKGYFTEIKLATVCGICKNQNVNSTIPALFESLGYSACTYTKGLSITQGFKVNSSAIEAYKAYAPDFTFGVLATVNSEGEAYAPSLESENVISTEFAKLTNNYVDIKVKGIPEDKADALVVLCAYVKVGDKTLYLDAGVSGETVVGISYNEANN